MTFIGKRKFCPRDIVYGGGDGGGLSSIDQSEPLLSRLCLGHAKTAVHTCVTKFKEDFP
jgi:hypothetical protein